MTLADNPRRMRRNGRSFNKLQKAEDGKKAMSEYEAEAAAIRAKTERGRVLRLARDAAPGSGFLPPQSPLAQSPQRRKSNLQRKRTKRSVDLSDWLNAQEASGCVRREPVGRNSEAHCSIHRRAYCQRELRITLLKPTGHDGTRTILDQHSEDDRASVEIFPSAG